MELYKNIDIVQIDLQPNVNEYSLPKNVDWKGKKIDKLVVVMPEMGCISVMNGLEVIPSTAAGVDVYFDLYDEQENEIGLNIHADQLAYSNNNAIRIDNTISLNTSKIHVYGHDYTGGELCLLLYVCYGGRIEEDYELPTKSETVRFPMMGGETLTFSNIINTYLHVNYENVRGIIIQDAEANPAYLTLRDYKQDLVLNMVHTCMMRPQKPYHAMAQHNAPVIRPDDMAEEMLPFDKDNVLAQRKLPTLPTAVSAKECQYNSLYFDKADIDFDNSVIANAMPLNQPCTQTITFLY